MIFDLDLFRLSAALPLSLAARIALTALILSLSAGLAALIRNRRFMNSDADTVTDFGTVFENPASLLPHFIELRDRLIRSLIAIVVGMIAGSLIAEQLLALLSDPIGGLSALQIIRVTEGLHVYFQVALTTGVILASPYVIAQLWIFIAVGLKPNERRWFYLLFPFALILFLSGVLFAYLVMLPAAVPFLTRFLSITTLPALDDYVGFVTTILLWSGISFELPLVILLLVKLRVLTAGMLARQWRVATVIIMIIAAVITPTPDPVNMGIVAAPLLGLYLLSVVLAFFVR